ncbi:MULTISPECIES: hypothetical protein [unclassified Francisella]|uniref:hypothetical protein n=1 Tax=unclassified Francisella TaxID=2610885 RepID=UPI002E30C6CA|nr:MULTISPECIES: hypothetical protein [unclassified Francisella]MED7818888.1 hypothetical protein [Francisella sp. 19S2-4]MED7829725.1 hypothetical protein [Francisella sp. 19S2-10]
MIAFPRNYKNCIRYINENYPGYKKHWYANWNQDNAVYIIKKVTVDKTIVNIWINIWLLIKDTKNLAILKSCLDIASVENIKSQILEKWLMLYNYVLYPELLTYQNHIYRNGEIFFSIDDYNNNLISVIEQFIRQSLGKYRVIVDLEYINQTKGSILGITKLNQPLLKVYQERLAIISGKILFRMLTQESREKLIEICEVVSKKLFSLTKDLNVFFKDILLVIDNGLETLTLGEVLYKRSLSGSFAYKVLENEKF